MPTYDFECEDCKKTFERYLPIDQRNESQECPLCPSKNTVRLMGLPGVVGQAANGGEDNSSGCCSGSSCDC